MNREEFQTERTRIISEMLDNPDEYGIYPTTKCFEQLDALFDSLSLPPAEGAEEIDELIKKHIMINAANFEFCVRNNIINGFLLQGIREVATLHAQRIADKMVRERLREAFDAGMEYDRMIHGNCIDGVDFETWYNRLKTREK